MSKYKLNEIIDFNPTETIRIGSVAKKVSMDKLIPFCRSIHGYEYSTYSAGPKFRNGDTLVAKITPCLENGKTAYVDVLEKDEVAYGSSEFIVLRANPEKIDPEFLFYLATSPAFRYRAISCMEGTSGRKRVNEGTLANYSMEIPDVATQRKIAALLSSLDRKIQLNKAINCELTTMAKELYDYWFVQFDFPDENGNPYKASGGKMVFNERLKREIPEGWTVCTIGSVVASCSGGDWGEDDESGNYTLDVNCIRGADITTLTELPKRYINKYNDNKLLNEWDIVIEISGGSPIQATGRSALVTNGLLARYDSRLICSNFCQSIRLKQLMITPYFFYMWNMFYSNNIMFNYEGKTSGIKNFLIDSFLANYWVFPSDQIAEIFGQRVTEFYRLRDKNTQEILELTKLRDELLPLLMTGQVEVAN